MRIAYLCKRQYMAKDVINDRYGRLYEIPYQLAQFGHEVRAYCLSYQRHASGSWRHETATNLGQLDWESRSIRPIPLLIRYPWQLLRKMRWFKPDVIICASDIPHVALGAWLAKRLGCPFAADLYDDFESFSQARIPGMKKLLRGAVRRADLVTTTSAKLAERVTQTYRVRGTVLSMPSSIDKRLFHWMNQSACRRQLGLPTDAVLIGTAGGLKDNRGIGTLYQAWEQLAASNEHCHLVLAGPVDKQCPPPDNDRVHYLGLLAHSEIATLFNALDIGVIYLADDAFGRYCFPQKAYEMIACGLPIVAAAVGAMPNLMRGASHGLYHPGETSDLLRAVRGQLAKRQIPSAPIKTWAESISEFEAQLRRL